MDTKFDQWLDSARGGDKFTYYRGYLGGRGVTREGRTEGKAALLAYGRGYVELTQRKLGDRNYEYIAVKRREIKTPKYSILDNEGRLNVLYHYQGEDEAE